MKLLSKGAFTEHRDFRLKLIRPALHIINHAKIHVAHLVRAHAGVIVYIQFFMDVPSSTFDPAESLMIRICVQQLFSDLILRIAVYTVSACAGGCFVAGGFNPEYKFIFPAHKAFQRGFTSFGPIQIDFPFQTACHFPRSMAVHTQIPVHRLYGGVVPEIASRSHTERIGAVADEALKNCRCRFE